MEIPDEYLPKLEAYQDRPGELLLLGLLQVKIHENLLLYQRGLVSLGRAAELVGFRSRRWYGKRKPWGSLLAGLKRWWRRNWREKQALYLALREKVDLVQLDELKARAEAQAHGLTAKGTLVLEVSVSTLLISGGKHDARRYDATQYRHIQRPA